MVRVANSREDVNDDDDGNDDDVQQQVHGLEHPSMAPGPPPQPSDVSASALPASRLHQRLASSPMSSRAGDDYPPYNKAQRASGSDHNSEDDEEPEDVLRWSEAASDAIQMERLLPHSRRRGEADPEQPGMRILEQEDDDEEDPMRLISQAVPETDDPTLPALTFRVMVIGTAFCITGAAVSQLFFYRSNSPSFSTYFVILASLPLGQWMAKALPRLTIRVPFLGSFQLNPGPFNVKEHLLIAVLASSGATSAYASDIINIQELFFHQNLSNGAALVMLITTQTLGFGFAGLVHDILVRPVSMIYPANLVTCSLFYTLHGDRQGGLTRKRLAVFNFVFVAIFVYQFLPSLIAPTLSSIALLCLINNQSNTFRVLSSGYKGYGFLNFSFDWNAIGASGPLFTPWWAQLNFFVGIAGMMYIVAPLMYFSNFWDSQSFPSAIGSGLYNTTFKPFDVQSILNHEDKTLDRVAWQEKKPMVLTPFFAMTYFLSFTVLTSMLTHVALWHWNDICRAMFHPPTDDVHNRLMRAYDDVPHSWYAWIMGLSLAGAVWLVWSHPELQLPVWGLFMSIGIGLVFVVPVGVLKAVSNTGIGLNVITEFVAGYVLPGKPIANVLVKCYGYMTMSQSQDLLADLKLAHYMKVPPKSMALAQIWGTVVGCVVNLIVVRIVLHPANGYRNFLDGTEEDPTGQWTGRKLHIFYSASIIWGVVGPAEFFAGKYYKLYWGFLLGAILPLIPWVLHKRFGKKFPFKQIAIPILIHGAGTPPQLPTNIIMTGFVTAWLSQQWARRRHPRWFERYNNVLSAALDAGTSINALACFFLSISVLKIFSVPNWFLNPAKDSEHCTPS